MITINVSRSGGWVDRFRSYEINFEGSMQKLKAKSTVTFKGGAGEVEVTANIDWAKPAVWKGSVSDGEVVDLFIEHDDIISGSLGNGQYLKFKRQR